MAASSNLTFRLIGKDVSASKTFQKFGATAAGAFAGIGLAAVTKQIADFGKETIDKFAEVGSETTKLQRVMGGTAEDASRLRSAFQMTGVDSDTAGRSIGLLSKHIAANDKTWKSLGIAARDAHGKLLPTADLLPQIAEKFKDMPAGAEKTALALQLFGRNGAAMLPFLNKGAEGIRDLYSESDKLGTTLSGKDLAAVKENTIAKRKFGEALEGVQITIGRYLLPMLTKLANWMTTTLVPAFATFTGFLKDNADVLMPLGVLIGGIIAALKVWAIAQAALNVVMALNPIGLVIIAIAALIAAVVVLYKRNEWFRNFVNVAWAGIQVAVKKVADFFMSYVWPVIQKAVGFIIAYYKTLWTMFTTVVGWIVPKAQALGAVFVSVGQTIYNAFRAAFNGIASVWNNTVGRISFSVPDWVPGMGGKGFSVPNIPQLANGGIVSRPTLALIGERGPEAVVPLSRGGGMGPTIIVQTLPGNEMDTARAISRIIRNGRQQGLAF